METGKLSEDALSVNMKALILVGGFCNLQGQIVSFTSRPIVFHQLRALSEIGVKQVILAVSYMPQQMVDAIPFIKENAGSFSRS